MTRIMVVKHLGSLRPVDEHAEGVLRSLGQGEIVTVELRKVRNVQHHRLFWALMSLVWEQLDHEEYPDVEDLVVRVKIATGHRQRIELEGGMVAFVPKSISFAKMDQAEFNLFFDRCCDWVAANVLPGVTREDLRQELEAMTGIREKA